MKCANCSNQQDIREMIQVDDNATFVCTDCYKGSIKTNTCEICSTQLRTRETDICSDCYAHEQSGNGSKEEECKI